MPVTVTLTTRLLPQLVLVITACILFVFVEGTGIFYLKIDVKNYSMRVVTRVVKVTA